MAGYRDFTYNELAENIGTATGDFFRNAANAAADLVCTIQEQNTRWLIGAGDPLGAGSAAAGLYDSLCRPRGKPLPVPDQPATGGLCATGYTIKADLQQPNCSVLSDRNIGSTVGPVANVRREYGGKLYTGGPNGEFAQTISLIWTGQDGTGGGIAFASCYGNNDCPSPDPNFRFVRNDGQPDTCGNPVTPYPDTEPSPGGLTVNAPINITPDISVNVPVTIVSPPKPPDITVKVGPVYVNFDLGGIHVSLDPTINFPTRTDPRPSPPPNPIPRSPTSPGATCDLSEVLTKLNALLDCDRCDQQKTYKSVTFPVADSGTLALPARCYAVSLELTERPDRIKTQFGQDGPDVIYAGWGWFGRAPYYEDRQPVDTNGKLFVWKRADIFPDTFAYTLYQGYKGRVRALYYDLPVG